MKRYIKYLFWISIVFSLFLPSYALYLIIWTDAPPPSEERDVFGFKEGKNPNEFINVPNLQLFKARDGDSLRYRFYNSESSRTLIFLHGSSYHGLYLHPLAKYLSKSNIANVCLPNLRGHYFSGRRRGDVDYIGQYEDDIVDLIKELRTQNKKNNIYLGGHSSGGGLAIRFAGSDYRDLVKGYLLLTPMIPVAPSNRESSGGGWAHIYQKRLKGLIVLNMLGITGLNALPICEFDKPGELWDGTETLSYSYRLNASYHPRYDYRKDLQGLGENYLLLIGEGDEASDPEKFSLILPEGFKDNFMVLPFVNHLDIVHSPIALEKIKQWLLSCSL